MDGNAFLMGLAEQLRQEMAGLGAEVAHLKMTLMPDEGPDLAALSLTQTDAVPRATHTLKGPLERGELTVNLRAEADPADLRRAVEKVLAGVAGAKVQISQINAFRPGRPNPTHRMGGVGKSG
jgi:hypothetical protein